MNKKYRNTTPELRVLESQILNLEDFTDVAANGTINITDPLPAGAIPIAWKADVLTAFSRSVAFTGDPTTLAFVDGGVGSDTITDSASGFVTDGFQVGDTITISGATTEANDIEVELTAVAAGTLTFATGSISAEEAGAVGMTLTGAATVTATLKLGVSTDVDRFSADTAGSVASVGTIGSACLAADACDGIADDQTVMVTVTEATDFSDYTDGSLKVELFYIKTEI